MYRGPRIRIGGLFLPFIFILFFGRELFFIVIPLIVIVAAIYILSKVITLLSSNKTNTSYSNKKTEYNKQSDDLDKYFNGSNAILLSDNISVVKDNSLFFYYKGEKIESYYEVVDGELEDKVLNRVNGTYANNKSNKLEYKEFNYNKTFENSAVNKPELVNVSTYESRFEAFISMLRNVDYGNSNSRDYVDGHIKAISKYMKESYAYQYDLTVIEEELNKEIESRESNATIEEKGYYDGLIYVLKALRKSKELIIERIKKEL